MDWKSILHKGILRGGICLLLSAAIILGLVLPGTNMKLAQPTDPLENESIREISVLKVGDNINELQTIVIPNGGSAAPTEPNDDNSEETDPEQTLPNETVPKETESEEPDIDEGEEGNEDGTQGEEGGEEMDLALAAVLTWYPYGTEERTLVCGPDKAVSKTLNTAQLIQNELEYKIDLSGEDAEYVRITSVSLAEGDTAYREISQKGSISINLPGGTGTRRYTFKIEAQAEKENENGELAERDLTFTYVLKCEYAMDLQMQLRWQPVDKNERIIACGPDKAEPFSVQSYDVTNREFAYSVQLTGSLAEKARITEARYTTLSGHESGVMGLENGSLRLYPAPGDNKETYFLTFTVETPNRMVQFTYNLVYQEQLDVKLAFNWMDRGMISHNLICRPGLSVSEWIKNNQLSGGGISYEMTLDGKDGVDGQIVHISYKSERSDGGELEQTGSIPMSLPDGAGSNTYRITVHAMVKGQRMTFEIVLHHSNDVMLQMIYDVQEDGKTMQRLVSCENQKSKTAETIYDDQLDDGILEYSLSIAGSDSENVDIANVTCFQSGTGESLNLSDSGRITLQLAGGKTGENTFMIRALDDSGEEYNFTINIPFKHRGENNIQIKTNLTDQQEIPNMTKTNLTVQAWSEDVDHNVVDYIPANGTDTKLIVKLDGTEITYTSTSGTTSEYDLVPENPEVGDTNEHILHIYAEDAQGNYGEKTLTLIGQRREPGQKIGTASVYVDMTVLGIGIVGPVKYTVRADEPVSYVIAKAVLGEDLGEPFGKAESTLGWDGSYAGSLDDGFYLQSLHTGYNAKTLTEGDWPGSEEEEILQNIDAYFGKGTGLATLWRCIYRNGLTKFSGSGSSFGEYDYTNGSGWMYSIGGATYHPGQSMSSTYLQDGDVLTLQYTLAYGWDVGGGSSGIGSTVGYCVTASDGRLVISHRMEKKEKDGVELYTCRCCGLTEDCAHEKLSYKDLGDGTHIACCTKCGSQIGDWEEHKWVNNENADHHVCGTCNAPDKHRWQEIDGTNTATCDALGEKDVRCSVCGMENTIEVGPLGHDFEKWDHDEAQHWRVCKREGCTDTTYDAGTHTYDKYESEYDEHYCSVCGAGHEWDYGCYEERTELPDSTCSLKVERCACGAILFTPGSFDHDYEDGSCRDCGKPDPNYSNPSDPGSGDDGSDNEGGDDTGGEGGGDTGGEGGDDTGGEGGDDTGGEGGDDTGGEGGDDTGGEGGDDTGDEGGDDTGGEGGDDTGGEGGDDTGDETGGDGNGEQVYPEEASLFAWPFSNRVFIAVITNLFST